MGKGHYLCTVLRWSHFDPPCKRNIALDYVRIYRQRMCLEPQRSGGCDGIDAGRLPPGSFVGAVMNLAHGGYGGNAIRRICISQNIEIDFENLKLTSRQRANE
jgi:hypothetical protein